MLLLALFFQAPLTWGQQRECVVLLHGLARTSGSMGEMERKLQAAGFAVVNVGYPSREHPVEVLARQAVEEGLQFCSEQGAEPIHFVSHSLGSILVRYYFQERVDSRLGRVVMLGPPNQGAELVDALAEFPGFGLLNGPSAEQLGTGHEGIADSLGAVNFELGVIAGDQAINPFFAALIPGPDDGKVSVESTRVKGMREHLVMPVTHTWMMFNNDVIDQVISFLQRGYFISLSE
jgi:pimeloyl-ACP methyl ester carboxylesterase